MRAMYGVTIFLGAFLLFALEPMAAKGLLPVLGGSSAVWLACLFFFQTVLLLGYGYADRLTRWSADRRGAGVHLALLLAGVVVVLLPRFLRFGAAGASSQSPVATIFWSLARTIGLPFLLLSATSPLLQVTLARRQEGTVPYGLFGLSNLGSLLALLLYPLAIEPHLTLRGQRLGWATGFAVYAVMCGWLVWTGAGESRPAEVQAEGRGQVTVAAARPWLWFCLSAVGAVQLSAVTSHLTQNVAAIPLLWAIPLAIYLLSFVLAFDLPGLYQRALLVRLLVVMLASLGYLLSKTDVTLPIALSILFFLVEMFAACWFCHAELYRLRPEGTRAATRFYLTVAAGGAAGTFFVGVLSPVLFRSNYDLPLAFAMTAAVALWVTWDDGWGQRMLWTVSAVLGLALVGMLGNAYRLDTIVRLRNFYGALRVKQKDSVAQTFGGPIGMRNRVLLNGSIEHGMQWYGTDELRRTPMTYYAEDSGVGLVMRLCCEGRSRSVGVIGLGAGTMAAYGREGDVIEFYEINPLVERLARELFTYLRESRARVSVMEGDARLSLTTQAPQRFDVLVVDAFSGDAIPVHLLTVEAMREYRRHLRPGGLVAFHISNQYLDLAPVVGRLAEASGMEARLVDSSRSEARGEYSAKWVVVGEKGAGIFGIPEFANAARSVAGMGGVRVWTDDYSSLLPVVNWAGK